MKSITKRGSEIAFGSFALKTLDQYWITARQIEAARQAITREMKRQGQLWIRIFPDRPVTAKGLGVRMGKGKGTPEYYAARIVTSLSCSVASFSLSSGVVSSLISCCFILSSSY